jgi:hypothetical protein
VKDAKMIQSVNGVKKDFSKILIPHLVIKIVDIA